ncbi:MAG TPA: hypothetical protein VFA53_00095 [Xanthobacteraceae bacterium]|nr:hypothetical protein [Xanthobacteraceae bacterium]
MNAELLNLSWQVQVSLASGYVAYTVAYLGFREHHRPIDTILLTLVFGLFATATLWFLSNQSALISGAAAFFVACISAVIWRKWGVRLRQKLLRVLNLTWGNDDPSALATLTRSTDHYVTQVGVALDDGTWLTCEDTSKFSDAPFGPCIIGPSGDIGLYLTQEEKPNGKRKKIKTARNEYYGDRITYIPASRIRQITLRHRAANRS